MLRIMQSNNYYSNKYAAKVGSTKVNIWSTKVNIWVNTREKGGASRPRHPNMNYVYLYQNV